LWNLWERLLSTMKWGENDSTHRAGTRNGSYDFIHVFCSWRLNIKGRGTILSAHEFMPTYCNQHPRKKRRPKEEKLSRQGMTLTLSFLVSSLFPIEVTDFSCAISWKKADGIITYSPCVARRASWGQRYACTSKNAFLHIHDFQCNNWIL
jgi:hypothetical protein